MRPHEWKCNQSLDRLSWRESETFVIDLSASKPALHCRGLIKHYGDVSAVAGLDRLLDKSALVVASPLTIPVAQDVSCG
jgi:hypothetical protein